MKTNKAILSVRLNGDLKERWQAFCVLQGSNPSDALRQVIIRLLNGSTTAGSPTPSAHEQPDTSRHRMEVRLNETEYARIEVLALQQGMSANRWVIHLIRANLSGKPQFGMTELRTLGESNSRLLAIGHNLNQIARHMNAGRALETVVTAERIDIDMTLNTFVQVKSGNVISKFTDIFIYGGTLTFVMMGFAIIFGYVKAPASNFMKTCGKFIVIGGLAMSAPTYLSWVVEALRGLETGVADAFSASGSSTSATSVYQVLDKAVSDGFQIGGDMLDKMGKRRWYQIGMVFWDPLNSLIIYAATLIIAIPAGAMVIVAKIMLTLMLGIGPFFIAMLIFPATAKWSDSWFGQVMTYIMQIALVTTVLGMGMKFFSALTAKVLAVTTDYPIATMLEILIVTGVTLFLLKRAYEAASHLAGGVSSAGITLRQVSQAAASPVTQVLNRQTTRRDMQSGMMVTGGRLNHLAAGNTMWNTAYRQHVMQNMGKNWGPATGGSINGK